MKSRIGSDIEKKKGEGINLPPFFRVEQTISG